MTTLTLALDLEGTLISTAGIQFARFGLYDFLELCRLLSPRMVIFTSIPEQRFRGIAEVDDYAGYVHPGQEAQWVPVKSFHAPVLDTPAGVLSRLLHDLEQRMLGRRTGTIGDARGAGPPPPESAA